MSRACAGFELRKCRVVGDNRPFFNVQLVDHDLVDSEIGDKGKAVVGTDVDRMCVRALLAVGIDAGTGVLH